MRVWHLACRRQHKTDDGDYDENPTIIEDIVFAYANRNNNALWYFFNAAAPNDRHRYKYFSVRLL